MNDSTRGPYTLTDLNTAAGLADLLKARGLRKKCKSASKHLCLLRALVSRHERKPGWLDVPDRLLMRYCGDADRTSARSVLNDLLALEVIELERGGRGHGDKRQIKIDPLAVSLLLNDAEYTYIKRRKIVKSSGDFSPDLINPSLINPEGKDGAPSHRIPAECSDVAAASEDSPVGELETEEVRAIWWYFADRFIELGLHRYDFRSYYYSIRENTYLAILAEGLDDELDPATLAYAVDNALATWERRKNSTRGLSGYIAATYFTTQMHSRYDAEGAELAYYAQDALQGNVEAANALLYPRLRLVAA